ARDENASATRTAPAGTKLWRRIHGDDAFLTRPREQASQHSGHGALGASRRGRAILQGQAPNGVVEFRKIEVTYPRLAEGRENVDIETRSLLRQRRLRARGAVPLRLERHQVTGRHVHQPDPLSLKPSRPPLRLAELL